MPFNRERFKELRKKTPSPTTGKAPISLYELSLETGVDRTTLLRLQSGEATNPSYETVKLISDFFKKNMETFWISNMSFDTNVGRVDL